VGGEGVGLGRARAPVTAPLYVWGVGRCLRRGRCWVMRERCWRRGLVGRLGWVRMIGEVLPTSPEPNGSFGETVGKIWWGNGMARIMLEYIASL